jgi:hypothetical protein
MRKKKEEADPITSQAVKKKQQSKSKRINNANSSLTSKFHFMCCRSCVAELLLLLAS